MKRLLYILFSMIICTLSSCSTDEPQGNKDKGFLKVNLAQAGADEDIDFSDYKFFIISEKSGFGWTTQFKEISWPINLPVGEYIVIVESPLVSENETTRFYYTAMERNVPIHKDKTTELSISLELEGFPKD